MHGFYGQSSPSQSQIAANNSQAHIPLSTVISKVTRMTANMAAKRLVSKAGLAISKVTWEDLSRTKNSCWGPCISDMTLEVNNDRMPVIRQPNYTDKTWDVPIERIPLVVGNEQEARGPGSKLTTISLKSYLKEFSSYTSTQFSDSGFDVDINLLSEAAATRTTTSTPKHRHTHKHSGQHSQQPQQKDTHVIMSSQCCFLPIEKGKETKFNVALFSHRSRKKRPAILVIVSTAHGTSAQIIEDKHQKLLFNNFAVKSDFLAQRLTDNRIERGVSVQGEMTQEERQQNCIVIIQIPLIQRAPLPINKGRHHVRKTNMKSFTKPQSAQKPALYFETAHQPLCGFVPPLQQKQKSLPPPSEPQQLYDGYQRHYGSPHQSPYQQQQYFNQNASTASFSGDLFGGGGPHNGYNNNNNKNNNNTNMNMSMHHQKKRAHAQQPLNLYPNPHTPQFSASKRNAFVQPPPPPQTLPPQQRHSARRMRGFCGGAWDTSLANAEAEAEPTAIYPTPRTRTSTSTSRRRSTSQILSKYKKPPPAPQPQPQPDLSAVTWKWGSSSSSPSSIVSTHHHQNDTNHHHSHRNDHNRGHRNRNQSTQRIQSNQPRHHNHHLRRPRCSNRETLATDLFGGGGAGRQKHKRRTRCLKKKATSASLRERARVERQKQREENAANVEAAIIRIAPKTTPLCVCGAELQSLPMIACYAQPGVQCDICAESIVGNETRVWHCRYKKGSYKHRNGYDLCAACGAKQLRFDEFNGLQPSVEHASVIERDSRFPIRVTLQYYKSTDNGVVNAAIIENIKHLLQQSQRQADFIGSLVTEASTRRPTETNTVKTQATASVEQNSDSVGGSVGVAVAAAAAVGVPPAVVDANNHNNDDNALLDILFGAVMVAPPPQKTESEAEIGVDVGAAHSQLEAQAPWSAAVVVAEEQQTPHPNAIENKHVVNTDDLHLLDDLFGDWASYSEIEKALKKFGGAHWSEFLENFKTEEVCDGDLCDLSDDNLKTLITKLGPRNRFKKWISYKYNVAKPVVVGVGGGSKKVINQEGHSETGDLFN